MDPKTEEALRTVVLFNAERLDRLITALALVAVVFAVPKICDLLLG